MVRLQYLGICLINRTHLGRRTLHVHLVTVIRWTLVVEGLDVAVPFGIRILAKHHDRYVRLRLVAALHAEGGRSTGGRNGRPDALEQGGGAWKVRIGIAGSLPGDAPSPCLLADVVRAIACNQYVGFGG